MLVSIIIASYRQPQFLHRAIESVLEQDYEHIELLVVDDLSLDSSLAQAIRLQHSDDRVRIIALSSNGGLGRARNVGTALAEGELLCFLDADDYLLEGSISHRVTAFKAALETYGDSCVGAYGDWQHIGEDTNHPEVRPARSNLQEISAQSFSGENAFICSAPLVTRAAVVDAGGFPEGLPMLEDFALWAKIIARGGVFVPVAHVVAVYRQRPSSMLRGDGKVVMADYVEIINNWVISQGIPLAGNAALNAWLANESPRIAARLSWSEPSSFRSGSTKLGGLSTVHDRHETIEIAPVERLAIEDFMTSGSIDIDTIEQSEFGDQQNLATTAEAAVTFIPESVEQCLEVIAFRKALKSVGVTATIATFNAASQQDWFDLWPLAVAGLIPVSIGDIAAGKGTAVLFSDWSAEAERLVPQLGKSRVRVRTAGIDVQRIGLRHSAKRYRKGKVAHVRSLLEAAELGDRALKLLPSAVDIGVRELWGEPPARSHRQGAVVLVPRDLRAYAAIDAWITIALEVAAEVESNVKIVADPRVTDMIGGYRFDFISIETLRSARLVIAPVCDEVSLLELIDVDHVVFDPSPNSIELSATWRRSAAVAHNQVQLREAVLTTLNRSGPQDRGIAELLSFDGTTQRLGQRLVKQFNL